MCSITVVIEPNPVNPAGILPARTVRRVRPSNTDGRYTEPNRRLRDYSMCGKLLLTARISAQVFVLSACWALLIPVATVFGVSVRMVGLTEWPGCQAQLRE